jgi:hypothetical protein
MERAERVMKQALLIVGIIAVLVGLLWLLQGTGIFPYPARSMMIGQRDWSLYGVLLAVLGGALIFLSRRP